MEVQSLSVCVPTPKCVNNCAFCVSKMKESDYTNQIEKNKRFRDLYRKDYIKRLQFARDNGCNTVILTGDGEPMQNIRFLDDFSEWNEKLTSPFHWIEIQTSGILLDDEMLRHLRNTVGVNTISLSLSNMFDSQKNAQINGTPKQLQFDIDELCAEIKRYDFNLRLSLNMTDGYSPRSTDSIFNRAKELRADQITFRVLYTSGFDTKEDKWIEEHCCNDLTIQSIEEYIFEKGRRLEVLPFGATRYSVDGMSVVIDSDCMATEVKETIRYLVLRPNCKLYSRWDDKGSLIF